MAYDLAQEYLLRFASAGVTKDLLRHYLVPPSNRDTPNTMADVFKRLLESAQNRGMMATVIGRSIGGVEALEPLLGGFSPKVAVERYAAPEDLLDAIKIDLKPVGKFRRGRGSLWPLFAKATLSGARFLGQFTSGPEFIEWVRQFDGDDRKRAALPMLISQEIDGFGFALACDFLKELGFTNFAKPDVHIKAIVRGLGLSSGTGNDYAVFKAVVRIASHCGKTPYDVDKLFWLVGSGRFYDHPDLGNNGRIRTNRTGFVRSAKRKLEAAA
jgi:hypothetical protein